jgi:hypothetical protein
MEELTITDISIEDVEFSIEEAIDFLNPTPVEVFSWDEIPEKDDKRYIRFLTQKFGINWVEDANTEKINDNTIKLNAAEKSLSLILDYRNTNLTINIGDEKVDEILVKKENGKLNIYQEKSNELLLQSPNQIVSVILKDTSRFELDDNDFKSLLEIICEELGFKGQIPDIIFNQGVSPTKIEYKIYFRMNIEDFKAHNRNVCDNFNELILLKGFRASTKHGIISYADISKHVMNFTPKGMDLRVFTKLLKNDNTTYICFSELIYRKFTDVLEEDEHDFVQIDISEYVEEVEKIISSQLFGKICTDEHRSEISGEIKNMRNQNYKGIAKLWNIIENILRKIAQNLGYTDDSATLHNYLEYLTASANSHKRLSEETKCLIIAIDRNKQAHGTSARPHFDHKYLAILWMKAVRDIYHDWCRFQSIDLCFNKMAPDLDNQTKNDIWKIYGYSRKEQNKYRQKISHIDIEYPEYWASEIHIGIIFENMDSNQKDKFNFDINLLDNSIISYEKGISL